MLLVVSTIDINSSSRAISPDMLYLILDVGGVICYFFPHSENKLVHALVKYFSHNNRYWYWRGILFLTLFHNL